jgi:hypothetical protein
MRLSREIGAYWEGGFQPPWAVRAGLAAEKRPSLVAAAAMAFLKAL